MRGLNVGLAILAIWGWSVDSAEACHRCCRRVCCCATSVSRASVSRASALQAAHASVAPVAARAAAGRNTLLGDVNEAPLGNGGGQVPPAPNGSRPLTTLLGDVFDDSASTPAPPVQTSLLGDEVSQETWRNLALWQAKVKPQSPKTTFDLRVEALNSVEQGRVAVATDEAVLQLLHDVEQVAENWRP